MKTILKSSAGLLAWTAFGLIAACGADPVADGRPGGFVTSPDPNSDVELRPDSEDLDKSTSDNADVRDGEIRFPAGDCDRLGKVKPGSVILGDRGPDGSANPDGFLVKVTKVTCTKDGVIVATEPGTLQAGFDKLKLDVGFNLPGCKDLKKPNMGVEYGGDILTYTDGVDASLCFAPRVTYKADVAFPKLNSFEVSATGVLEAKLVAKAAVKLDASVDAKTREELAGKPLAKTITTTLADREIPLASVTVGPISVPSSLRFTTTLSCDLAFTAPVEVEVGAKETATITAGLTYENGKLSAKTDKSLVFEPIPPTFTQDGMIRATCTLTPTLSLKMFGIASGEIGAKVLGGMGASQTCGGKDAQNVTQRLIHGDVQAGVVSTALAKLDLIGLVKWKKECTLFSEDKLIQYDKTYPTPGGAAAATCAVAGPFSLPPKPVANPSGCFSEDPATGDAGLPIIPGTCTHDVCVAGEKLGQQCDDCTMKVCTADPYCCDTFWGLSCFDDVVKYCGKTCN
jgi:hypothetical protein